MPARRSPNQLSLDFNPGLPRPGVVEPMLPVLRRHPFDSADFIFSPSYGGRRALLFADASGAVAAIAVDGDDVTASLPSAVTELGGVGGAFAGRSIVLDVELVAVDRAGRPDASGVVSTALAFDLLHLDGAWLLATALERRLAALDDLLGSGGTGGASSAVSGVVAMPWFPGEGIALHAAATDGGLAGVLARQRTSPYLPGVRSRLWRFVPSGAVPDAAAEAGDSSAWSATPLLAVIRRLPLDFDE